MLCENRMSATHKLCFSPRGVAKLDRHGDRDGVAELERVQHGRRRLATAGVAVRERVAAAVRPQRVLAPLAERGVWFCSVGGRVHGDLEKGTRSSNGA